MHRLLRRPGLSLALAALIDAGVLSAQNGDAHRWDAATRRWSTTSTAVIRLISGSGAANGAVQVLTGASLVGPSCSSRSQPVVLLRGRAGGIIDAAGLTCNEP